MAGSREKREVSSTFWCINCGGRGIPIMRQRSHWREKGHRKALYCIRCKMVINHVETRNEDEARRFRENFEAGRFKEEAERSVAYAKEHRSN